MRAAILLVIVAVLCVAGAWWLAGVPGTLSLTIADTTIEAATPVAITLLALLFLVIYIVLRLIAWLISLPGRNRRWRLQRNRVQGDAAVNRTLIALAANDAGAARREAERSRRFLGDTPLTLLLAAQAGKQAGRDAEAESAFRLLAESKDGRLLGLRGLLRQAVQKQDWQTAAALAAEAEKTHPGARWLRDERRNMALRRGEWSEALRLSGPENRAALAVAAAEHETDPNASLRLVRQAYEADPALVPASVAYARRLREGGRRGTAQDVLRRTWSLNPHPDIAAEYVRMAPNKLEAARELAVLVRSNPNHAESHIAIGRAALDAGLTNEARKQVEQAQAEGLNQRRLWNLLADIAVMEGKPEEAQDALRHVQEAGPDPVWRCTRCGTQHAAWHPICDVCDATGTIAWAQPTTEPAPHTPRLPEPEAIEGLTS